MISQLSAQSHRLEDKEEKKTFNRLSHFRKTIGSNSNEKVTSVQMKYLEYNLLNLRTRPQLNIELYLNSKEFGNVRGSVWS